MNPIAFKLFGFEVAWYGVMITIGVLIALAVAYYNTTRGDRDVDFDHITDAFLYAFPLALVGARLYYVFFEWEQYSGNWARILDVRGGGLAIHGGIIGAAIGVLIYKIVSKKPGSYILRMVDAAAPSMILAQAIGRWGNFFNQEAHGGPVSESFIQNFPEFIQRGMLINGTYYHPTFLYESLWNLLVFAVLMYLYGKRKKNQEGTIFYLYLILYSIGRYFIEGMRTDSLMFLGMRQAQLFSLLSILAGAALLVYKTQKARKEDLNAQAVEKEKK